MNVKGHRKRLLRIGSDALMVQSAADHPVYDSQTPPTSSALSYTINSTFSRFSRTLIAAQMPENPAPMTPIRILRSFKMCCSYRGGAQEKSR